MGRSMRLTYLIGNLSCRLPLEGMRQDLRVYIRADSCAQLPVGIGVVRRDVPRVPERLCIWRGTAEWWVLLGWRRRRIFQRGDGNRHLEFLLIKRLSSHQLIELKICAFSGGFVMWLSNIKLSEMPRHQCGDLHADTRGLASSITASVICLWVADTCRGLLPGKRKMRGSLNCRRCCWS